MQLPFFNGLIWGTLIGGAGLVVLSLSHDVLNLKGLNPEVTVLPISQSPDTAMTAQVPVIDLDSPLGIISAALHLVARPHRRQPWPRLDSFCAKTCIDR